MKDVDHYSSKLALFPSRARQAKKLVVALLQAGFVAGLVTAGPLAARVELPVSANMDLYRAGGYNDGSDGLAPAVYSFAARPGRTLRFSSVSGSWTCSTAISKFLADGLPGTTCAGANIGEGAFPFSGYDLTGFAGAMAGVFLEDTLPVAPPPALRFYNTGSRAGIRTDFQVLSPAIGQIFFIGDGLTGTGIGNIQSFRVPATATHLYLGFVDTCTQTSTIPGCYFDNVGTLTAVFNFENHVVDWVEPTLSSAPSARIGASMTYDAATHTSLLFGGNSAYYPGSTYGDTWVWSNRWTQLSPTTSPVPRGSAGMVYDPTTRTVVLFGGFDNSSGFTFDDTWTWDGITWTQRFPPISPPARAPSPFGMVYDAASERVVLFGGYGPTAFYGDTWEWDGRAGTWTEKFPATSPSPRGTSLSYDAIHQTVVLFGGENGQPFFGDTWNWDGFNWTKHSPASSPSARTRQTMAYDDTLGAVVLFGGTQDPPESLNDTWAWTGTTWKQLSPPTSPSSRYVSSMDFDPASDGLVLFGGEVSGNTVTDQTWLYKPIGIP